MSSCLSRRPLETSSSKSESVGATDRGLAARAVVEGSATYYMERYLRSDLAMFLAFLRDSAKQGGQEVIYRVPVVVTAHMVLFPYVEGRRFLTRITAGDSGRISDLYGALPETTEQILHPGKYGPGGDYPFHIQLPDFGPLLPEGWEAGDEDQLGELTVALLLNEFAGGENREKLGRIIRPFSGGVLFRGETKLASEGWDGDRVAGYFGPDGAVAFVWASRWDSPGDAREFATAYKRSFPLKRESLGLRATEWHVEVRGDRVVIVEGFPEAVLWDVVARTWQKTRFGADPRDDEDRIRELQESKRRLRQEILRLRRANRSAEELLRRLEK